MMHDAEVNMRTTLTIDDDVLAAAKGLAEQKHQTVGEVISALTRQALRPVTSGISIRNGITLLPIRGDGQVITDDLVNQLRDELPE
jgi:hypothetical protein